MTNEEWIKSLSTEDMAGFIRMEILDYLSCWDWDDEDRKICHRTGNECRFACMVEVKNWLKQEHKENE